MSVGRGPFAVTGSPPAGGAHPPDVDPSYVGERPRS